MDPYNNDSASEDDGTSVADSFGAPKSKRVRKEGQRGAAGGLRLFTDLVCRKLRLEGTVTSNEIAERLVKENGGVDGKVDDNIRRRVYDALNVLLAVGIAKKDGKYIKFAGGEVSEADMDEAKERIQNLKKDIETKKETIQQLIKTKICLTHLIEQNKNNTIVEDKKNMYSLPFLVLSTSSSTNVEVEMSKKKNEMLFTLDSPFLLRDSNDLIRELGYDHVTEEERKEYIPRPLLNDTLQSCPLGYTNLLNSSQQFIPLLTPNTKDIDVQLPLQLTNKTEKQESIPTQELPSYGSLLSASTPEGSQPVAVLKQETGSNTSSNISEPL
ncbi:hypothetical protein WA158_002920 [Blastocystis sp. Blastoise]